MKMRHNVAGVENARHENARNAIVWNTACCICLSIAEQKCMSRQERAPDFAANCGCPICRSEITMVLRLYWSDCDDLNNHLMMLTFSY